jgi:D-3-phosphoglycerate dehydrogenase
MNVKDRVAVCSRSFSRNEILREELLSRYQHVTFNDCNKTFDGESLIDFLSGHQKAIVGLERIDKVTLSKLPELQVISKYGVGLDKIDIEEIQNTGRKLGWTGGVNKRSVSELALASMISLLRQVPHSSKKLSNGEWAPQVGFLLSNKVVGIIGCGFVGQDLIELLRPFNCKIQAFDIANRDDFFNSYNVTKVDLEELMITSDVISIHVPLTKKTQNFIDPHLLNLMKPSAILINTARGGIVNEDHVLSMLKAKRIHGAAFDVFEQEPPQNTDLLKEPNFLCTPHIGGNSIEGILAMGRAAISGLGS